MLSLALHPAGYRRDQGGALPAAVLRLVESHLTLRRQILQSLLHDSGETGEDVEKEGRVLATKEEENVSMSPFVAKVQLGPKKNQNKILQLIFKRKFKITFYRKAPE